MGENGEAEDEKKRLPGWESADGFFSDSTVGP